MLQNIHKHDCASVHLLRPAAHALKSCPFMTEELSAIFFYIRKNNCILLLWSFNNYIILYSLKDKSWNNLIIADVSTLFIASAEWFFEHIDPKMLRILIRFHTHSMVYISIVIYSGDIMEKLKHSRACLMVDTASFYCLESHKKEITWLLIYLIHRFIGKSSN